MKNTEKKILLISHNPLSQVNNNGKTMVSIFEGVPKKNIYQIYLNGDIPDYSMDCHYLQLNEKQILHSLISGNNSCCQEITSNLETVSSATIKISSFGIHTKRLLRECVWKLPLWKSKMKKWLSDKQFDVVFFMAGDGLFAYDVYRFVMQHVSAKGCLFFTDDYIIGRNSYSPVALFRQFLLRRKVKNTLSFTKEMYVISEEMRKAYSELYHMNAYVVRNFSVEKKKNNEKEKSKNGLTIVYAGGLHYNRWKVLSEIGRALKDINEAHEIKCCLKIYSSQNISSGIVQAINVEGASEFCGSAKASQIADIYANADILLHVESFDKRAIASTKYSFSTKIPEYLSASKCVLAVGPSEVASIRYLEEVACVISDITKLHSSLSTLIQNKEYREEIKLNCIKLYEKDFSQKNQKECLKRILSLG